MYVRVTAWTNDRQALAIGAAPTQLVMNDCSPKRPRSASASTGAQRCHSRKCGFDSIRDAAREESQSSRMSAYGFARVMNPGLLLSDVNVTS